MNEIEWTKKALKQRRKIASVQREKIAIAVNSLEGFSGTPFLNVIQLTNHDYQYRLRVGDYRVLFNHDGEIQIIGIKEVKKRDGNTY